MLDINTLDLETLQHVFVFLPIRDVPSVQLTCRRWRKVTSDESFWKAVGSRDFGQIFTSPNAQETPWKEQYRSIAVLKPINYHRIPADCYLDLADRHRIIKKPVFTDIWDMIRFLIEQVKALKCTYSTHNMVVAKNITDKKLSAFKEERGKNNAFQLQYCYYLMQCAKRDLDALYQDVTAQYFSETSASWIGDFIRSALYWWQGLSTVKTEYEALQTQLTAFKVMPWEHERIAIGAKTTSNMDLKFFYDAKETLRQDPFVMLAFEDTFFKKCLKGSFCLNLSLIHSAIKKNYSIEKRQLNVKISITEIPENQYESPLSLAKDSLICLFSSILALSLDANISVIQIRVSGGLNLDNLLCSTGFECWDEMPDFYLKKEEMPPKTKDRAPTQFLTLKGQPAFPVKEGRPQTWDQLIEENALFLPNSQAHIFISKMLKRGFVPEPQIAP